MGVQSNYCTRINENTQYHVQSDTCPTLTEVTLHTLHIVLKRIVEKMSRHSSDDCRTLWGRCSRL